MTTDTTALDEAAIEAFAEKVVVDMAGAYTFFMASIGDRLGLFADLAERGPATSRELSGRTGLAERYVREWLWGMAAAGYLDHDTGSGEFSVPAHRAPVLAEEAGQAFFGAAFYNFSTNFGDTYLHLLDAFRTGDGVLQDVYRDAQQAIERFTAPWFTHSLVPEWLPLMPDVQAKLEAGAAVCDVGCGHGRALITLAQAFPNSTYVGYDVHPPAVEAARRNADEAGVADLVRFEVIDATAAIPGRYDVVTTFDVLHDSVDPEAILGEIHAALAPDGRYVCVDVNCSDNPEENVGPMAAVKYGLSLEYCLPVSLVSGGTGLGTVGLPPGLLTEFATAAGFTDVRRVPTDDPLNNLYELTP